MQTSREGKKNQEKTFPIRNLNRHGQFHLTCDQLKSVSHNLIEKFSMMSDWYKTFQFFLLGNLLPLPDLYLDSFSYPVASIVFR